MISHIHLRGGQSYKSHRRSRAVSHVSTSKSQKQNIRKKESVKVILWIVSFWIIPWGLFFQLWCSRRFLWDSVRRRSFPGFPSFPNPWADSIPLRRNTGNNQGSSGAPVLRDRFHNSSDYSSDSLSPDSLLAERRSAGFAPDCLAAPHMLVELAALEAEAKIILFKQNIVGLKAHFVLIEART